MSSSFVGDRMLNVTLDGNKAPLGANLGTSIPITTARTAFLENTILSNPIIGDNCINLTEPDPNRRLIVSKGHNLSSDNSCQLDQPSDLSNADPLLGPLANNSGLTPTQELRLGSLAIDAGSSNCPIRDQRNNIRPVDGDNDGKAICDIGAFETQFSGIIKLQIDSFTPSAGGNVGDVTVTVRGSGFVSDAKVELREKGITIVTGKKTVVESSGRIKTIFDLRDQPARQLDVVVVNPDGTLIVSTKPFEVITGTGLTLGKPPFSMTILAPSVARPNSSIPYFFVITNNSQIDFPVDIGLQVQKDCAGTPCGDDTSIRPPPPSGQSQLTSGHIDIGNLPGHACVHANLIHGCSKTAQQVLDMALIVAIEVVKYGKFILDNATTCLSNPFKCLTLKKANDDALKILDDLKIQAAKAIDTHRICLGTLRSGVPFTEPPESTATTCVVTPDDPNEKIGPSGFGSEKFIRPNNALPYLIQFENKASALAPAQQVVITDVIDSTKFDLSTFSLGPITFGAQTVTPPAGEKQFTTDVDLRPLNNIIVRIDASLDEITGTASWRFSSFDADTMLPLTDPLGGFLPPNKVSPEGQGQVSFIIKPKSDLVSGAILSNKATIIFDTNAPIDTPTWANMIDSQKPTSAMSVLPATQNQTTIPVSWSGSDAGSGIRSYNVYVSVDGAAMQLWLTDSAATSATYTGEAGKTYSFYTVARDNVGNVEDTPASPTATVKINAASSGNPSSSGGGGGGGCALEWKAKFDPTLLLMVLWSVAMIRRRSFRS